MATSPIQIIAILTLFVIIYRFKNTNVNDNLPLIQDYPMQVFVLQTLISMGFYQFFIIF